ncbi:MAG: hypothetical protein AAF171_04570 [Cyanobacteria bacterium P01_A01_bin.116]
MTLSRWRKQSTRRQTTWFERLMALVILLNLCLVMFDLSYIPFRDLHLKSWPEFTVWYGERFKGIETEPTTLGYLALVDELDVQIDENGPQQAIESQIGQEILAQLSEQSALIINEDPFAVAGKSGSLERIKNLMHKRTDITFSKAAFNRFWSSSYLLGNPPDSSRTAAELAFFDEKIRPLMAANYHRGINERGRPIDLFWQIDLGFMVLFAAEFLARTYALSRRHPNTSWLDAMLWRIYDVPLFLGFWRWLRIIPTTLRLNQARWVDLEPLRNRLSRALISQFAIELTEIVLVRVINQVQRVVQTGDIGRFLRTPSDRRYIDINGVDEVQTLTKRLSDVVVYQVLPQVKPELDALLQHSVVGALHQAPAYQGLKFMPGFDALSAQISQQVVAELSKTLTQALQNALADETAAELTSQLLTSFSERLSAEIQTAETLGEVRILLSDLLEEIKINYVEGIAAEDRLDTEASRYQLYGETQGAR